MMQQSFDLTEILDRVEGNTDEQWREEAMAAVRYVCLKQAEFFVDDVWATGLESTRNDKALGPVLMNAKRNGWCVKTDRMKPSSRSHWSGKPVWRSLLFRGGDA